MDENIGIYPFSGGQLTSTRWYMCRRLRKLVTRVSSDSRSATLGIMSIATKTREDGPA